MKTLTALALIAATFSSAAFADTVRDGSYVNANGQTLSAPAYTAGSWTSGADARAQRHEALRAGSDDRLVAEGLRQPMPQTLSERSRDAVRAEALAANRQTYAASSQRVEGLSPSL